MEVKRVGRRMFIIGVVLTGLIVWSTRYAESHGYHDLIDETLWFPLHMVGGLAIAVAFCGLGVLGLAGLIDKS